MKKVLLLLLSLLMVLSIAGCKQKEEETKQEEETIHEVVPLYEDSFVVQLFYEGLDLQGLEDMNKRYGSESYGDANVGGGCSITFATYFEGTTGAIRNMDLQSSKYCAYEILVYEGENVKYPFWSLAYTGMDEKSYYEVLQEGVSDARYKQLPFTTTDTMSFGYNDLGDRASLYCAVLMRSQEQDDEGNYLYTCSGTNPGAEYRCATQSVPTLIAANCITIDQALAFTGAVDEQYNRIYPFIEPSLDVYTFSIETETMSNHWFEVVAMEDSTGRHGVLEFIDNKAIWHEGIDYSFNFFLQDDYLYNEDGTFKETHGAGLGRYKATVPYLDTIVTMEDHLALMDTISYSHMTYYNEENGYIGRDIAGNPIDWRSELTGTNVWQSYSNMKNLGLDTSIADSKYQIYGTYLDTNTNQNVVIRSLDEYNANKDHLKDIYTMNFVQDDANKDEIMNYIRWCGAFYNTLTNEEVQRTNAGWETYFRVIADPMNFKVTRWFNENISTADTYVWSEFVSTETTAE